MNEQTNEKDEKEVFPIGKANAQFFNSGEEEENEQLPIKDAEILSEQRRPEVAPADFNDEFALFMAGLPSDSSPALNIIRQPDKQFSGEFRRECNTQKQHGALNWNSYHDAADLYEDIAKKYGGGRYTIQVKDSQRFEKGKSWTVNIADPIGLSDLEKTELLLKNPPEPAPVIYQQQPAAEALPAAPKKSESEIAREYVKDVKEFTEFINPPAAPAPIKTAPTLEELTENIKWRVLDKALDQENLLEVATYSVLGMERPRAEDAENPALEVVKYVWNHTAETQTILNIAIESAGNLLAKIFGGKPAAQPPAKIYRAQPLPMQPQPQPAAPPAQTAQMAVKEFFTMPGVIPAAPTEKTQPQAQNAPDVMPLQNFDNEILVFSEI